MNSTSGPMRSSPQGARRALGISGLAGASALMAALFNGPADAQTAPSAQSQPPLQEVVITGSLIKRTDTETPSPV